MSAIIFGVMNLIVSMPYKLLLARAFFNILSGGAIATTTTPTTDEQNATFTPKCLGLCGALSKERYNDRTKIPGFF